MQKTMTSLLIMILWVTRSALAADCVRKLSFNAADNSAAIAYDNCTDMPKSLQAGQLVTVTIGATTMQAQVRQFVPAAFGGGGSLIELTPPLQPGARNVSPGDSPDYSGDAASVEMIVVVDPKATPPITQVFKFAVDLANPVSHHEHKSSIGPANANVTASTASGGGATNTAGSASAMRFQYTGAYVHFPLSSAAKQPYWSRGLQEEFTASIDTTNQKGPAFTDDNRAKAAVYLPRVSFGTLLNRARLGIDGQYSKAAHASSHDFDTTVVAEGWLPILQSLTLFSKSSYLAPSVNFAITWGNRNQSVNGTKSHGQLLTTLVGYHIYLLDNYRVDLQEQTIVNDASDRTPSSPRTQHSFKASILYSSSTASKFAAVASFENAHSGPVFTKARQYFIGVGLEHLFDKKTP